MVVAAIGTLVDTANSACNGNATEERIIASAKGVASSTAQLLLASRVKADLNSKPQQNLQVCFFLLWDVFIPLVYLCTKVSQIK